MKKGDLVRFKEYIVHPRNRNECGVWTFREGLLIEYHKWEKIATILSDKKIYRVAARDVQLSVRYKDDEIS